MIDITNISKRRSFDVDIVFSAVLATLTAHNIANKEVSVLLTDDTRITELNRDYRGCDSPTDVLAFSQLDGENSDALNSDILGDVVISLETAERQTRESNHSLENEVMLLTVHGVLHLLGYDHQTENDAIKMFDKQNSILNELLAKKHLAVQCKEIKV